MPSPATTTATSPRPHGSSASLHTPVRRLRTSSTDSDGSGGVRRTRFNSREFFQQQQQQTNTSTTSTVLLEEFDDNDEMGEHLMPLELGRSNKMVGASFTIFLTAYASLIVVIQFLVSTLYLAMGWGGGTTTTTTTFDQYNSTTTTSDNTIVWHHIITTWTVTNAIHLLVTILYIHWLKGSFLLDEQGELNAMTTWEQLEASPYANVAVRRTLLTLPTVLAYTACVTSHFDPVTSGLNVVLWSIAMLAKLPMMNGVRLFGINRTAGIDDGPPAFAAAAVKKQQAQQS